MGPTFNQVQETVSVMVGGPLFTLFSVFIGVAVTHFYYRFSLRDRSPLAIKSTLTILRMRNVDRLDKLEITYDKKPVKEVSLTTCTFWNEGKEAICFEDFSLKNPLSIVAAEGVTILSCIVERQSASYNECSVEEAQSGKVYSIKFSHFDHRQGVRLQVLHDGGFAPNVVVTGVLKGTGEIKMVNDSSDYWELVFTTCAFFGFAVLLYGLIGRSAVTSKWALLAPLPFVGIACGFLIEVWRPNSKTPPDSLVAPNVSGRGLFGIIKRWIGRASP